MRRQDVPRARARGLPRRLPDISDDEDEMLDCSTAPRDDERSHLSCQPWCGTHVDELEVAVPPSQL
ncbi:hypothetical protein PU560_09085 [Georgenia sp. 10Sc9-8]|uniref:Uncharacterized protein n=1 Tax=Georgenia halotolerans TaxID=3028317 RepID=A0ABT5TX21_9MICO|nr:hypothetical protein [Georgenia halotolerans]